MTTPQGGRVIRITSGEALDLTPAEVQLLGQATVEGVDPADPKLGAAIRKLAGMGLLVPADGSMLSTTGPAGVPPGLKPAHTALDELPPSWLAEPAAVPVTPPSTPMVLPSVPPPIAPLVPPAIAPLVEVPAAEAASTEVLEMPSGAEPPGGVSPFDQAPAEPAPKRRRSGFLSFVGALVALGATFAAGWYLGGEHVRRQLQGAAAPAPAPAAGKAEDAGSPAVNVIEVKAPVAVAVPAGSDAGGEAVPAAPGEAIPTGPPAAAADAGSAGPALGEGVALTITKRARVTMGELAAPKAGTVTWTAAPRQRVKRGEVVGSLESAGEELRLVAPAAGLLIPAVPDQAEVKRGAELGAVVYFEAYVQGTATGKRPTPAWSCEVSDEGTGEKAPCKVVTAVPRGAGFFVTAVTEPMWFDTCAAPRVLLAAP
ncbi:MAG: hypothetical protein ACYC8T_07395 [Myxococcaceae bacterium]